MNAKTVQQLKSELLIKKQNLTSLQSQNKKIDLDQDDSLKDGIDRADVEESWFTKERMSQHWKLELIQIEFALQKMETTSFGICEECEDEIPVKRLRVRPDATLCLNCQETMEKEMGIGHRIMRPASGPSDILQ